MRRILVIFGGCSTEYEVSLQSAAAVAEAIDVSRYEVLYLGISRKAWCCKALRNTHRSRKAYKRWDCRFM